MPSPSGGRGTCIHVHVRRRRALPTSILFAGVTGFVVALVLNEGKIQAGHLRYIAIPRQYGSYRRPRDGFAQSAPSLSCSSPILPPSVYNFSKDPRPPALVSYPGSGSTLTRLLLEYASRVYTGSVYSDVSLYNNSGHQFLGEFNTTNTSVVKTHFPVGPNHTSVFAYRAATRAVIITRDPRTSIPSYLNYQYGDSIGSKHSVQAPIALWEEWRDDRLQTELKKWIDIIRHWEGRKLGALHVMLYEDLTGSRATGVEALRSLIQFLGLGEDKTDDDIACVWEEVLGRKAQDRGIRRSKKYTPAYTAEQHSLIASELRKFADSLDGNASSEGPSPLTKAIRTYAAKKIPSNEMATEREIPSWPPANCEIPSMPPTLIEDAGHRTSNFICPNGTTHTFDCHVSVCAAHLIPPQVERYSQTNLHEPHESKIFAALMMTARPNDLFVDMGAAIGYFAALALKVNRRALVYAFDPLIEFKKKLGTNIWLNFGHQNTNINTGTRQWEADGTTSRICVDGRAMSNRDGEKDWIGDDYGGQIKTKVEKGGFGEIVGGNEVNTVRLDTVLKEIGRDPYLVMLDVQGMERYILNSNSTLDVLRTGRIKLLAIGIHENSLGECRSLIEGTGAYIVVVAESEVPLQPDGILIAVAKGWLRSREITELIGYARSIIDRDYDSFITAIEEHIRDMG